VSKYFDQKVNLELTDNSLTKIVNLVGKNKNVIDFGCSSGYVGRILRDKYNCKVFGIEIDASDAKEAEKYYEKVLNCDLETYDWASDLKRFAPFNVAIFADILEHLRDPFKVLKMAKGLLGKDGFILVSIPNVAHTSVRLELLSGNLEYEDFGILDNSHLHFYTKKTASDLIKSAGFFIELIDSTSLVFSGGFIEEYFKKIKIPISNKLKDLFLEDEGMSYQYIFKASLSAKSQKLGFSKTMKPMSLYEKRNQDLENNFKYESQLKDNYINELKRELSSVYSSKAWRLILGLKILFKRRPRVLLEKIKSKFQQSDYFYKVNGQYRLWLKKNYPTEEILKDQIEEAGKFLFRPKISIICPIYNTPFKLLTECINSVLSQSYDNWELCIADDNSKNEKIRKLIKQYSKEDKRIKYIFRKKRGNISSASNSALKIATGEFVGFLDHDDVLEPNALFEVVRVLNENSKADFIYSDEDKLKLNGERVDPFFKPDWSPDLFLSVNYLAHFSVIRKSLVDKVGGFRKGFEGSQDYDLFLRVIEQARFIKHISKILYSWRRTPGSTAAMYSNKDYAFKTSIRALKESLMRRNVKAKVTQGLWQGSFRVQYKVLGNPKVSIIIPTKDKVSYLRKCLDSILINTTYKNYEIILISNNSLEKETFDYLDEIKKNPMVSFYEFNKPYNYSQINNFGVEKAKGDFICLLNNDTKVITSEWLEEMISLAQRKEIGAVGVKLLYPNGLIQHAGVVLGITSELSERGVAGHVQKMQPDLPVNSVILSSKDLLRNFSAVTAACLVVEKSKFLEVGGLNENLAIAFNDVDFCLKLMEKGYFNVYTPYAKLYHYESISVGDISKGERDLEEFKKEIGYMHNTWGTKYLTKDPFYNPNFSLNSEQFDLRM
jgi:GT2 family glycosyltransferase/SAM-dependent methyltransferase